MNEKRPPMQFNKNTLLRVLRYLTAYPFRLACVAVCIVITAYTGVASSLFLRTLIDDHITPLLLNKSSDFSGLLKAVATMGLLYLLGIVASLLYNYIMVTISQSILRDIRNKMFAHMQTLPIHYFDTHSHGDIMSYYTNDTDTLEQLLSRTIPSVFSSLITIISVIVSMLSLSVWLTLFSFAFVIASLQVTKRITMKSRDYFVHHQDALGKLNGFVEETINGQKVVKVFCHEAESTEEFDRRNDTLQENAYQANRFANILGPIMNNLGYFLYVCIAVLGGALALFQVRNLSLAGFGLLTLGTIASFLQLSRSFMMPINQVTQQFASIIMAMAGAERVFRLMDEESEKDEGYVTLVNITKDENGEIHESPERTELWAWKHPHQDGSLTYTELKGDIRLFDVDFGYTENKLVLHDISLYAEPGQKLAFVGATGAGKTTITNLINRFYDIADGKIRYDGININKIRKSDLRRSLGIVLQDVNLFTGTVLENLRYGRLDATDEECMEAAKLANADGFIRMLPNGYQTEISGTGDNLSQGQRQLISIARAAVANPPVMILDEATSSIDTQTEAVVQKGMDALMKGRTVFVIAHRLSTIHNSDAILVLDHGRIIERGDHDALIALKGTYYKLYTGVFELE